MAEEWRDILNYEGLYQVSNLGNVMSINYRNKNGFNKILKPRIHKGGYLRVALCKNCNYKYYNIHRLVAQAFQEICGKFIDEYHIDHINHIRTDNNVNNLRCITPHQNLIERYGKTERKTVVQKNLNGDILAVYESTIEAEKETGVYHSHISRCCNGTTITAGGYKWNYINQ